jgi:copper transport protein
MAAVFVFGNPVAAHSVLVRSDPADGAIVATAPREIRLTFSAPVELDLSTLDIVDVRGTKVVPAGSRLDSADPNILVIELPELVPGAYRVAWRVPSRNDLHGTSGQLVFSLGSGTDLSPLSVQPGMGSQVVVPPIAAVVEAAWLGSLLVLVGSLTILGIVLPRGRRRSSTEEARAALGLVSQRMRWIAAVGAVAGLASGVAALFVGASAIETAPGDPLGAVGRVIVGTEFGSRWLASEAALLALLAVALVAFRGTYPRQHSPRSWAVALIVALAIATVVLMRALGGHAADLPDAWPLRVPAIAIHILGALIWAGSVVCLVMSVLLLRRSGSAGRDATRSLLAAFGPIAALSLVAMGIAGIYMAGGLVASIDALATAVYGQALLIKILALTAAAFLGLRHAAAMHPAIAGMLKPLLRGRLAVTPGAVRSSALFTEAAVALAAVVVAGAMSVTRPAIGPEWDRRADELPPSPAIIQQGGMLLKISIRPGRPGPNFVTVDVYDTRRPPPGPVDAVTVGFGSAGNAIAEAPAVPVGPSRFELAGAQLGAPGEWDIKVTVQREGLPAEIVATPWRILPPASAQVHPLWLSDRPLSELTTPVAALALLALPLPLLYVEIRRRRRRRRGLAISAVPDSASVAPAASLERTSPW